MNYGDEIDAYVVVRLRLDEYRETGRSLPPTYRMAGPEVRASVREDERRLLQSYFRYWRLPYEGRLKGWREQSPIFVLHEGRLVAGVYVCDGNEFDDTPGWGQLHYPFVDPAHAGKGIYGVLFQELVSRARSWGLEGIVINSDRHLHPETYLKWGARPWKTIPKPATRGEQAVWSRVLHRMMRACLPRRARGEP